jgi:asparagine synthase (glutamine-hydrolysing)
MNIAPYVFIFTPGGVPRSPRLMAFAKRGAHQHGLTLLRDDSTWLALGARDATRIDLPDGGMIWGHVFSEGSATALSGQSPLQPFSMPAEAIVRNYWGGYLAIRHVTGGIEALRDPSGEIPCFVAAVDDAQILTSRPDILIDAGLLPADIDWTIVAQALAFRDLKPARTALRGISELLPGMVLRCDVKAPAVRCVWSPWTFAQPGEEYDDFSEAVAALRVTALRSIAAWADQYRKPVVEISGGLDSAIVAAGLAKAGSWPTAINFWPTAGDPDERPYARAIAETLGLPLRETPLDIGIIDLATSHARDLPRASARGFAQAMDRTTRDVGADIGADAFFGGTGGDSIFCHLQSALPVVDRYLRHGIGMHLWRTIEDVAHLAPSTVWEVARSAMVQFRRREARLPRPHRNRFMAEDAVNGLPWPAENPWLESPPGVLPGKRRHIWSLLGIQNHLEGYARLADGPILSPLLTQPMMELCIRIPTWHWSEGGRNRAVARAAFADILPEAVIARRSKGGFDSFGAELVDRNRALLRSMLLDGALARHGLLDTGALQRALERPVSDGVITVELLGLVDQEAWVRAWQGRPTT